MKKIIFILILPMISYANDANLCQEYVSIGDNYKHAHTNKYCLSAAESGSYSAQYQVGMGFGFSGNVELEEKYYRLSANQGGVASYLGLGHLHSETNIDEAIFWYERYAELKIKAYGYAALSAARLHFRKGNYEKSKYWINFCLQSTYKEECILNE